MRRHLTCVKGRARLTLRVPLLCWPKKNESSLSPYLLTHVKTYPLELANMKLHQSRCIRRCGDGKLGGLRNQTEFRCPTPKRMKTFPDGSITSIDLGSSPGLPLRKERRAALSLASLNVLLPIVNFAPTFSHHERACGRGFWRQGAATPSTPASGGGKVKIRSRNCVSIWRPVCIANF